jgi:hypothetical protein
MSDFGSPPDGAALIATVDDARYLRVDWIMREQLGGRPEYYCPASVWETTPAARLAEKDAEIAALRSRVAELEQQRRGPTVPPSIARAATGMPAVTDHRPAKVPCDVPSCTAMLDPRGLGIHKKKMHGIAGLTSGRRKGASRPAQAQDGWRCADCDTDAFAQDLHDPARCIRCAKRLRANGHEVAV